MKKLKKIGVVSLASTFAVINAVFGLLLAIITVITANFPEYVGQADVVFSMLNYWIILVYPLIYAIAGFVTGVMGAWIYNLLAKKTGGVKIDLN